MATANDKKNCSERIGIQRRAIEDPATIHRILDHLGRQARGPLLMPVPQAE